MRQATEQDGEQNRTGTRTGLATERDSQQNGIGNRTGQATERGRVQRISGENK